MRIFFASSCSSETHHACWRECGVRNYLFSYANEKALVKANARLYEDARNRIIIDSGAFTVWTQGKTIDIGEYADFLLGVEKSATCTIFPVNLDVLPGRFRVRPTDLERQKSAEAGWENYEYLTARGLKVLHVFHQHESFEWLDMLAMSSDYIGISPANDVSPQEREAWLRKVYGRLFSTNKQGVKTHGFGITGQLLSRFPFYSVDSSSWLAPSLYGGLTAFDGRGLRTYLRSEYRENLALVAPHLGAAKEGYAGVTKISLRAYLALERHVTDLWARRGVVWAEPAQAVADRLPGPAAQGQAQGG